ncbi:hypothetical protein AAFF_G00173830 [Aldrovandia affinis]|uniref:SEFIR domain-containing protein n=1 Tax=Aldrovandia affinis TaxID=143900 RepID=A0AAD7SYZ8_9TELE|nr:hypothetical protein AAFF_G00173830 [Aldrovandia affinis]
MRSFVFGAVLLSVHVILTSGLRILDRPPLNCTQEGLTCKAEINNCFDRGWLKHRELTPTGPQDLTADVDVRRDETGDLVPVLAKAQASIKFMEGTEVHVLEASINLNRCVHYIFGNTITGTNNSTDDRWSFSLDRVVVDPDQQYVVSVNNLPKPNLKHDTYDVSTLVTVPGCMDARIKTTKICVESGSLWKSYISLERSEGPDGKAAITVGFDTHEFSEKYKVAVQCSGDRENETLMKRNRTSLKVTFALVKWPRTCCIFKVEIQPFFMNCQNDCTRRWEEFNICSRIASPKTDSKDRNGSVTSLTVGIVCALTVFLLCTVACVQCRKRQKDPAFLLKDSEETQKTPITPRKVLLIYSLDHPLYKDIVLKLCAFLRAKCGIEVVLDLLDTAWLGAVGRMQWLDWQKQQIERSSDKILILCSRGVWAKWRAMCGEGRVMLKEDARSPMGDMLTPALSLIVPDLLHAAAFQKYMVAYFEDVSSEDDVPAPFNITIKYKLMKHFEELYFRILDKEKHEPGKVNRVDGIAQDEYFNCPSGGALRDAVETLQAYQLENPDWFERECVDSEEEVAESELQHPLLANMGGGPVFECVPECREGPPILVNEVEVNEDSRGVQELIPLVQHGGERLSIHKLHPNACSEQSQAYFSYPAVRDSPGILDAGAYFAAFEGQQPAMADGNPSAQRGNRPCQLEESPRERRPTEDDEEPRACSRSVEDEYAFEAEAYGNEKGPPSGSDQGYISRSSVHRDPTLGGDPLDPLVALSRLQEACLLNSLEPLS